MTAPLMVFAGLAVVVVICGALEARSPVLADEVKVVQQENVIGPVDMDLLASCSADRSSHASQAALSRHSCQDRGIQRASLNH